MGVTTQVRIPALSGGRASVRLVSAVAPYPQVLGFEGAEWATAYASLDLTTEQTVELTPTGDIALAGGGATLYQISVQAPGQRAAVFRFSVPSSGAVQELEALVGAAGIDGADLPAQLVADTQAAAAETLLYRDAAAQSAADALAAVDMPGRQGPQGEPGPQGPQGAQGLQGPQGPGIPEAPVDGTPYARQDADWVPASTGGGSGTLTATGTPEAGQLVRWAGADALESRTPAQMLGDIGAAPASHTQAASTISDSTAAGRALLTGADAAAQRTSLGLGSAATTAATAYATAAQGTDARIPIISTLTDVGRALVDTDVVAIGGPFKAALSRFVTYLSGVYVRLAGVVGGQTIIGGTGVDDPLTLQGTSGSGAGATAAIKFLVGNNGETIAADLLNNGSFRVNYGIALTGLISNNAGSGGFGMYSSNTFAFYNISALYPTLGVNANYVQLSDAGVIKWGTRPYLNSSGQATDVGLARRSAGELEVNNATRGTLAAIAAAKVTVKGLGTTTGVAFQIEDNAGNITLRIMDNGQIQFLRLPTSAAGLASGTLWNNAGILGIA